MEKREKLIIENAREKKSGRRGNEEK